MARREAGGCVHVLMVNNMPMPIQVTAAFAMGTPGIFTEARTHPITLTLTLTLISQCPPTCHRPHDCVSAAPTRCLTLTLAWISLGGPVRAGRLPLREGIARGLITHPNASQLAGTQP